MRQTAQHGPEKRTPEKGSRLSATVLVWWLLSLALFVWYVTGLLPSSQSKARIPYSVFLEQMNAGNVSRVHIAGDAIDGAFVKPLVWPPTKETAKPPSTPSSPSSSSTHTAAKAQSPPPTPYREFATTFPAAVGDPGVMPLLIAHHVVVDVSSSSMPWIVEILVEWGPLMLLFGFFWWMTNRTARNQSGLLGFGRMRVQRYSREQPKVTFNDVAGTDEAKSELEEEIDFLKHPQKYHDIGARIPKGVLLVGAPGTGKTLLARAVAGEAGVPFFSINASEFVEMFVGVGASRVRDLFRQAKEEAPAIVFIDELDAVGRRRGAGLGAMNDEREQTLNQLLGELDGFDERFEVIVLAATNRPDVLDPALLRPGRFDRQVVVGLPDRKGREEILRIHTRKLRLAADVDLVTLARGTIGMSGADLANLCNEAALAAARHNRPAVTMADFEESIDKIRLGAAQQHLVNPSERRVVAYHECGHTVVAWMTPAADPVYKVTIVPHGQALGVTEQIPGEDRHNLTLSYLMARIAVMLGGRTAEEIVFGEVTTGAENDLVEATRLARRMVTRWGMSKLGLVAFKTDEQQPFLGYEIAQGRDYSEATAARIDQEVLRLLEQTHDRVKHCLTDARDRLDRLVEALLREETVNSEELSRILGPRLGHEAEEIGQLAVNSLK
jgi:cell division protease FtsH